jgi:hypothetical protein
VVAFVAELAVYGFCQSGSLFPELLCILETSGATGLGDARRPRGAGTAAANLKDV